MDEVRNILPELKKVITIALNNYHGLNKSEKYWWFLGGFFALFLFRAIQLSRKNKVNWSLILSKGRVEEVFYLDLDQRIHNSRSLNKFHFLQEYEDPYPNGNEKIDMSLLLDNQKKIFTENLEVYKPISNKILIILSAFNKIIYRLFPKNLELNSHLTSSIKELELFRILFINLAPKSITELYPNWFSSIANLFAIARKNKNYKIYNGFEVSIYDKIIQVLICKYSNEGDRFLITNHGFSVNFGIDHIFHSSVGYHPYESHINNNFGQLTINNTRIFDCKYDILLISPSCKYYELEYMSLGKYREFEVWYRDYLKKILDLKNKNLKIKIRFKDEFRHNEFESSFERELRNFEDCHGEYRLIISPYTSTIVGKCLFNNIDFLSYEPLIYLYDFKLLNQLNKLSNGKIILDKTEFERQTIENII